MTRRVRRQASRKALHAHLQVEQLEDRNLLSAVVFPNDPSFSRQWGLDSTGGKGGIAGAGIQAPAAWGVTTGSTTTVVGVLDTGIDYNHPDLYQNIWLNQAEIPTSRMKNFVDVDGDGLITFRDLNDPRNQGPGKITDVNHDGRIDAGDILAPMLRDASGHDTGLGGWAYAGNTQDGDSAHPNDFIGWNFVANTNNPLDDNDHGTHVAGIIGAQGNNGVGVSGVDWNVQLMDLKFLDSNGNGGNSNAALALNYAVQHGAHITNNSWGNGDFSQTLFDAINNARAHGVLFVVAAGNGGVNLDANPSYPASYNLGNVVSVAALTTEGTLAAFSNYGAATVTLAAPGSNILSTVRNGGYAIFSGTSMAAPFVTGTLALVRSQHPAWKYYQILDQVFATVDPVKALAGKTETGGRLDAFRAVSTVLPDVTGPHVVSAVANASGASPVSSVRVTFSKGIDSSRFTTNDIVLTGPQGALTVKSIVPVYNTDDRQFDIVFTQQSATGAYKLMIGPAVYDVVGNAMDQNGNGINGEGGKDSYTATFVVSPTDTFTNSTSVPIPDLGTSTTSIAINQDFTIGNAQVQLTINHTFDHDLYVYLIAPDGTEVLLINRRGGAGHNFTNTLFDDAAPRTVGAGAAPFTGSYQPETPLSALVGKNARGTWKLVVQDRQAGDSGTLLSWSLILVPQGGGAAVP